jgi:hypothetical protein
LDVRDVADVVRAVETAPRHGFAANVDVCFGLRAQIVSADRLHRRRTEERASGPAARLAKGSS